MTKIFTPCGNLQPLPFAIDFENFNPLRSEYNSLGYRSEEFNIRKNCNIMSLGCSWAFGDGVKIHERWSSIVANNMNATDWNFGSPGSSNDYISRICLSSIEHLNPDWIFVLFTRHVRREYINQLRCLKYIAGWRKWKNFKRCPLAYRIFKAFDTLRSEENDIANMYWNYKFVESYLNHLGKNWLFSWIPCSDAMSSRYGKIDNTIFKFVDKSRYIGDFSRIDLGSDNSHPGPKSHALFANKILEKINSKITESRQNFLDYHDPIYCYKDRDVTYYYCKNEENDLIYKDLQKAFSVINTPEKEKIHNMKIKYIK